MSLRKLIKKSLLVLGTGVVLTTVLPVGGIAQDNINTPGNIFSQWVKLSLMGYNQSEIEATLNVYQSEEIQLVKRRLRRNVLNNLVGGNQARHLLEYDRAGVATYGIRSALKFALQARERSSGSSDDPPSIWNCSPGYLIRFL